MKGRLLSFLIFAVPCAVLLWGMLFECEFPKSDVPAVGERACDGLLKLTCPKCGYELAPLAPPHAQGHDLRCRGGHHSSPAHKDNEAVNSYSHPHFLPHKGHRPPSSCTCPYRKCCDGDNG